jgi:hypothetical protein
VFSCLDFFVEESGAELDLERWELQFCDDVMKSFAAQNCLGDKNQIYSNSTGLFIYTYILL